jgi:hypothetical protein
MACPRAGYADAGNCPLPPIHRPWRRPPHHRPPTVHRRAYKREIQFLVLFMVLLGTVCLIARQPVNDGFVEPFTAAIANVGVDPRPARQQTTMNGTRIYGKNFAVDIENGCNGIEAMIIFRRRPSLPASRKARLTGLVIGTIGIQIATWYEWYAVPHRRLPSLFDSLHRGVADRGHPVRRPADLWRNAMRPPMTTRPEEPRPTGRCPPTGPTRRRAWLVPVLLG